MKTMLTEQELQLVAQLRINSREKLTTLSRKLRMPVSTIHEKLKRYKGSIIKKNTVLLNFQMLGFPIKIKSLVKVDKSSKKEVAQYLSKHQNINNCWKINNGYDFMFDSYFRNLNESEEFFENLESEFKVKKRDSFYVLDELKSESFLSNELFFP